MRFTRFRTLALLACVVTFFTACELAVHLDRSAADSGDDAGCAICTNVGDDAGDDGSTLDSSVDSPDGDTMSPVDAHPDGPTADAGDKGGG